VGKIFYRTTNWNIGWLGQELYYYIGQDNSGERASHAGKIFYRTTNWNISWLRQDLYYYIG
jgi:hypothetical protein